MYVTNHPLSTQFVLCVEMSKEKKIMLSRFKFRRCLWCDKLFAGLRSRDQMSMWCSAECKDKFEKCPIHSPRGHNPPKQDSPDDDVDAFRKAFDQDW